MDYFEVKRLIEQVHILYPSADCNIHDWAKELRKTKPNVASLNLVRWAGKNKLAPRAVDLIYQSKGKHKTSAPYCPYCGGKGFLRVITPKGEIFPYCGCIRGKNEGIFDKLERAGYHWDKARKVFTNQSIWIGDMEDYES